jgi:hypothetical protein
VLGALFANYHGKWASAEALPLFELGRWQPILKLTDKAESSALKSGVCQLSAKRGKRGSVAHFFNWEDGTII